VVDVELAGVKWYKVDAQTQDLETRGTKTSKGDLNNADEEPNDFSNGPQPFHISQTPDFLYGEFRNKVSDQKIIASLENKNIYEVTFKNEGGLVSPLIIEWTFKDGSKELETIPAEIWRTNENAVTKVFIKSKEVINIVVDPTLETSDVDIRNNTFPKRSTSKFNSFKK
jgi:hypothetical protein